VVQPPRKATIEDVSTPPIRSYSVILEPDPDGGYVAIVPALPGCYSQGDTEEEAVANAREAIELTIEDMFERGEVIPDPSGEIVRKVAVGG
jgi:predicted RNase H-like HicB family nuclease